MCTAELQGSIRHGPIQRISLLECVRLESNRCSVVRETVGKIVGCEQTVREHCIPHASLFLSDKCGKTYDPNPIV